MDNLLVFAKVGKVSPVSIRWYTFEMFGFVLLIFLGEIRLGYWWSKSWMVFGIKDKELICTWCIAPSYTRVDVVRFVCLSISNFFWQSTSIWKWFKKSKPRRGLDISATTKVQGKTLRSPDIVISAVISPEHFIRSPFAVVKFTAVGCNTRFVAPLGISETLAPVSTTKSRRWFQILAVTLRGGRPETASISVCCFSFPVGDFGLG